MQKSEDNTAKPENKSSGTVNGNRRRIHFAAWTFIVFGIVLNMMLGMAADKLELPLYFDTIGTMLAAALGGYLPGIAVGFITNLITDFTDSAAIYYCLNNVMVAVIAAFYADLIREKEKKKMAAYVAAFILSLSFVTGVIGGIQAWLIEGFNPDYRTSVFIKLLYDNTGLSKLVSHMTGTILIEIIDKAISVLLTLLIIRFIPEKIERMVKFTGWKQNPDLGYEVKDMKSIHGKKHSIRVKVILVLTAVAISMAAVTSVISLYLFRQYTLDQHIILARGVSELVRDNIDAEKVDEYIEKGEAVEGYKETEKLLYDIRNSSPDVEFIYVYKIMEDGCHVVFDLDTEEFEGGEPGELVEFDESFSENIPLLLEGREIEPIVTDDTYGWLLTVYTPVYNKAGKCVCYAAADVAMKDIVNYEVMFIVKLLSIFSGFFILVLAIGLWLAKYNLIYPINTIANSADEFAYNSEEAMEENVERIKELAVCTGDEVENLYEAIVKTIQDSVNYFTESKRKTEMIAHMQSGLIMLLAEIVENRDESTGDHIRKTADYTRVIMEGLKKKGYYTDILTDDYIEDVVRSAPLHDIGKIQIPDAILNKPGKLTDEEFAIMKTHTTAGEKFISQAIDDLSDADYLKEAIYLTGYHHEKWNGKGYPRGLKGEEIPLSARIMAVADVFDALVSRRCYKEPFTFEKAIGIIREEAGQHFDPKIVEVFLEAEEEVRQIAERYAYMNNKKSPDK